MTMNKLTSFGSYLVLVTFIAALLISALFSLSGMNAKFSPFYGDLFGFSPIALVIMVGLVASIGIGFLCETKTSIYRTCLALSIIAGASFQILPALEGYFLYGNGDPSNHLGSVLTILQTGKISSLNWYPAMHIFTAIFLEITSLPMISSPSFLGEIIYFTFVLGSFSLIPKIFASDNARRVSMLVVTGAPVGSYMYPTYFALALLPVLMLSFQKNSTGWNVIFFVLSFALTISHPLVALLFVTSILVWHIFIKKESPGTKFAVLVCYFVGWLGYNLLFKLIIVEIVFKFGIGPAANGQVVPELISFFGLGTAIEIAARQILPLFVFALLELVVILKWRQRGFALMVLALLAVLSMLFYPASLVVSSLDIGIQRFLPYISIASFLLAGVFFVRRGPGTVRRTKMV